MREAHSCEIVLVKDCQWSLGLSSCFVSFPFETMIARNLARNVHARAFCSRNLSAASLVGKAFTTSFARTFSVRANPVVVAPQNVAKRCISVRRASNSSHDDVSEDTLKAQDLVSKLQLHPEIRQLLQEFQELIVTKGFNPEKPPSFMEMMKLFAHKDVCDLVAKLKVKLDEAGIKISRDDMGLLMKLFK